MGEITIRQPQLAVAGLTGVMRIVRNGGDYCPLLLNTIRSPEQCCESDTAWILLGGGLNRKAERS
jgi:hypothetical protein